MTVTILRGHCLDVLATLEANSIQACVTSPPYFGLRSYQTEPQVWGGDGRCAGAHEWYVTPSAGYRANDSKPGALQHDGTANRSAWLGQACDRCGAWRGELGQESTPDAYVSHLVDVFRAVRRVLRDDGVLMLNIGDSYAGSWGNYGGGGRGRGTQRNITTGSQVPNLAYDGLEQHRPASSDLRHVGVKPKDLIGIPWMLAFALRADGWWLRGDYIWAKPAPMPESVRDRCTRSHEYVFHLTKSERYTWYQDAIREPLKQPDAHGQQFGGSNKHDGVGSRLHSGNVYDAAALSGANKRSVWTINTAGYGDAHFAVMPDELAETCIKATTREGDTVIDPFGGAGTTALAADRLGRHAVSIELNPAYADLAQRRLTRDAPLFADVELVA